MATIGRHGKPAKRPCRICRHWFRPDPRVGARQRACRNSSCQKARHQQAQASGAHGIPTIHCAIQRVDYARLFWQTPSLGSARNEIVGIPCAPLGLGLLVTGLLAGGITTSPLTSTYPRVSRNQCRQIRQGLFARFPMATYCRHPYSTPCAILCQPAFWWVNSAERRCPFFASAKQMLSFSSRCRYLTALKSHPLLNPGHFNYNGAQSVGRENCLLLSNMARQSPDTREISNRVCKNWPTEVKAGPR